jgi:hypothetical protein
VRSKAREVNLSEILIILNSLATSNNWKKKLDVLASVYYHALFAWLISCTIADKFKRTGRQGVEAQSTMCINVHERNSRTTGNVRV